MSESANARIGSTAWLVARARTAVQMTADEGMALLRWALEQCDSERDPVISAAVTVGPGDTLVIGFGRPVRPDEADRVRKVFRDQMPGVGVFLIDNVTAFAVVKAAAVLAAEMGA
jgi:hypothetical protein